jgi:transcriptional regulator with PAS, ATPase and Fis domain
MVEIQGTNIVKSKKSIQVQYEDFIDAIDDVTPRFGKKYFQLPELWPKLVDESVQLLKSLGTLDQSLKRVAITGKSGTGKTTFAKYASQQLGFDCIRYTSDHDLIGATEQVKLQELREMYEDCLKCSEAVLIIDNLEIILGYNPFLRYISNNLFQLLKTILSNNSKANELIIIVTVADESFLEKLQLLDYIDCAIAFGRSPPLTEADHGGMRSPLR